MIAEAKKSYNYVIVDLPPMSAAPDAEYMMGCADASMLVVKQNLVKAKPLNKAIAALEKSNAELLGCVVNDVYAGGIPLVGGRGYGYGYGYGNYKK